jgi:hypothetical protein
MSRLIAGAAVVSLAIASAAQASTFTFNTDPFAGTAALTTAGRQIIAGETFISFNPATDQFALGLGIGSDVHFANDVVGNLPTGNVNVVVLRTFDNDANPATPFGAGNAADLIAAQITSPGPGFFVYFNSALDVPRLVFSTDLNDNTADLKVLFRMVNLTGATGQAALGNFTAENFTFVDPVAVPEPTTMLLTATGAVALVRRARRRRQARAC